MRRKYCRTYDDDRELAQNADRVDRSSLRPFQLIAQVTAVLKGSRTTREHKAILSYTSADYPDEVGPVGTVVHRCCRAASAKCILSMDTVC